MVRLDKNRPGLRRALLRRTGMAGPVGEKFVLGVTGGVGCGKSTVLSVLKEEFGADIIEADRVSEKLMQPGEAVFDDIVRDFGTEILAEDGRIDRKKLASIVYADPEKLRHLNSLVHPATVREIDRMTRESRAKLIVYETALPGKAHLKAMCRRVWYVYAPEETRIRRLTASRGYSEEKCRAIMARQMSEEAFRELADTVIDNSGTEEETRAAARAAAKLLVKKER